MSGSILVGGGQPLTVQLLAGSSPVPLYYDTGLTASAGTSPVIRTDSIFWAPEGTYLASVVTASGVELEGVSITLRSGGVVTLNKAQGAQSSKGALGPRGETYNPQVGVSDVVEGVPLVVYGDSYSAAAAALSGNAYNVTRWFDRLVRRLGSFTALSESTSEGLKVVNRAVSGWRAPDCAMYAYGTFTATAGGGSAVAGTWAPATSQLGIAFPYVGRNDAGYDGQGGTTAAHRAGFQNALVALIRLLRASAITEDTAGAFAYTGTWTSQADTHFSGGNAHHTATPGDKVTITTPSGTDFDLVLLAIDASINGAAFTITVDGNAVAPAGYPTTTNSQMQSSLGSALNTNFCQMAIPLHNLSAGVHTVVVTHAGTTGQLLYVDCLLTQSPNPMTVIIPKIAYLGATGYATYGAGASTATDDIYNSIIDTVVGLFPADGSVMSWNPNTAGWNPTYGARGHLSAQDSAGVHLNDAGAAFITDGVMGVLNSLPPREGLVTI